jgi:hypothetical protein
MTSGRFIVVIITLFIVILSFLPSGILAIAQNNESDSSIEVTLDSEFECGNKYWGMKNHLNPGGPNYNFGKKEDCTDNLEEPPIPSGNGSLDNYVKITTTNDGSKDHSITFQSAIQGTDPWDINATSDGGAIDYNNKFPLAPDLDYQLEARYIWFDDEISRPEGGNVQANLHVDLWFADTKSPRTEDGQYKNIMGIDFGFAHLGNIDSESSAYSPVTEYGHWQQRVSIEEGKSFFPPFARTHNGQTLYLYNVVVDTDGKNPEQWYETQPISINKFIQDAFSYDEYETSDGEEQDKPIMSDYELIDIEAGVEIWNELEGDAGTLTAGFSNVRLTYQ